MQLKCKKRFVPCMEKVPWLIGCVKSGSRSFLVLLMFWPNNSLLWVCLIHWKMFSSTPGLCPLEADMLKISKSIMLLVKMKNVSFILQKKLSELLGQPRMFSFVRNCRTVFKVAVPGRSILSPHQQWVRAPAAPHPPQHLVVSVLWNLVCVTGV